MPIYEYICESCEEEVEVIQKISDEPLSFCPSCNKPSLKKKTSMSAFHLKGGGWYKDGYGDSKSSDSSKKTKVESVSSAPTKDSATDSTTTATKSESKASTGSDSAPQSKAS